MHGPARERWWAPLPATRRPDPGEAHLGIGPRLLSGLRAAHALRAEWDLWLESGPRSRLWIRTADGPSARWFVRAFAPAYGLGRWQARGPPFEPPAAPTVRLVGRRRVAWPAPLWHGEVPGGVLERVGAALRALPSGLRLRVAFQEDRSPGLRWWEIPSAGDRAPSTTTRSFPRFNGRSHGPEAEPTGVRPIFWRVAVVLEGDRDLESRPQRSRLGRALDEAFRDSAGNGLRFRPMRWSEVAPARDRFSEFELLGLLPSSGVGSSDPEPAGPDRLWLGRTAHGTPVGVPWESGQGRHLAVLGETGMGKSSLLIALVRQIEAGTSVLVLDPIGDTARAIRREFSDRDRDRITWVDPSNPTGSLNALAGADRSERRLNDLVHALRRVRAGRYADPFWGPRLEEMLTRALQAAAALPKGTLADAHTLLATGGRAPRDPDGAGSEARRELSERMRERPDDAEGARRLLFEVVRSPVLARMVAARDPSRQACDLVAPGRITLVSGAAPEVGETISRYLLAVYLALAWSELLARRDRSKTLVVLDEAQWFAHESLSEMLRLGRRANVHVILATQALGSLPESVREAVWTNVADLVAFRGSPDEARDIARMAASVGAESILALPRGWAVLLEGKGHRVHWLRTVHRPDAADAGAELDSERSATRDQEILSWLRTSMGPDEADGEVSIALADLRAALRPEEESIRRVGAWLGRAGALRTVRRPDGTVWAIRRSRLPATDAEWGALREPGASEVPQRS